jgi:hypothetical protein
MESREQSILPRGAPMASEHSVEIARRGQEIYDARLRAELEVTNPDQFVAIEPDSGEFYLGESLSEAIQAARAAHPQQLVFALRVGHETTVDLGVLTP